MSSGKFPLVCSFSLADAIFVGCETAVEPFSDESLFIILYTIRWLLLLCVAIKTYGRMKLLIIVPNTFDLIRAFSIQIKTFGSEVCRVAVFIIAI